ncbi:MAG: ATP-binding protein [Chloroflexota bacterium]
MTFDSITLLKQVFPGMSDDALLQMAQIAKRTAYPANTMLCHEGADEEVFYIVGEGQVVVTQQLDDEERLLRYSDPGQYFGEMALIANTPRNASVRTVVDSAFLEVDKFTFIEIIRQNPIIALTMFRTSVGWLRSNDAAAIGELTAQKHELERAYKTLQVQERQRDEFLTTLAHELRTPLTTANGFMQLIRSGSMTGPALNMGMDKVAFGLERIVSLINDLLFVQEMDLIEPTVRSINLSTVLQNVVEELEDRAAMSNLTIQINAPAVLPTIEADPDGLLRALRALLDNAIKFSPGGGEIRIDVTPTNDTIDVVFTDPGIGIEPDFLPRIFDRFEHQEKRGDQLFGGMGLGLAIAQHLIESFGGSIHVTSEVDRGSVFTVRLPVLARSEASGFVATADGDEA